MLFGVDSEAIKKGVLPNLPNAFPIRNCNKQYQQQQQQPIRTALPVSTRNTLLTEAFVHRFYDFHKISSIEQPIVTNVVLVAALFRSLSTGAILIGCV
jgi:hypothetical protein